MSAEIDRILQDLCSGNYVKTKHARIRMLERCISDQDIRSCAELPDSVEKQEDDKFLIIGEDLAYNPLKIIVAWDGETVLITVIGD